MSDTTDLQPAEKPARKDEDLRKGAEEIVDSLATMASDIAKFPSGIEDARLQLALRGLDAALAAPLGGAAMTRDQLAGAVLLGRGLTFAEAAEALGITEGQLYYWDRTVPGFRREMAQWRENMELDTEARLYSTIARMGASMDDMKDQDKIRLLGLMEKISAKPESRARWAAEYRLEKEKIDAQKEIAAAAIKKKASHATDDEQDRVNGIIDGVTTEIYEGIIDVDDAGETAALGEDDL